MPYQYDISPTQKIYLDNLGDNTLITLASGGPGQQQQSGTQVATGPWTELPQVVRVGSGVLVRCTTGQRTFIWQVQGGQIGAADATAWPADQAEPMQVTASSAPVMQPMAPMQPMQMGDMQMSASPMTMRMGNMTLGKSHGNSSGAADGNASGTASGPQKFCTQCGAAVSTGDRFCGSCGHQLQ
ncbi:MAG: zinc ribbon domain-containing protein [Shackletoniella antarctica]|uniref:Zinc ribbon domain-containing protein n=1 Tax=Shackletoniella antarctica TaxID=268115 RepID=A0A2W4YG34_9CYAN|nr:MAG: zinc ribbon domain-containing protein [Shackletoniella antarctica]